MPATYTSDYLNAERASAQHRDTRTADQRRWDDRSFAAADYIAHLRGATYPNKVGWSRDAALLETVEEWLKDALREVRALRVEGFRSGDPVPRIEPLQPITTEVTLPAADHAHDQRGEAA